MSTAPGPRSKPSADSTRRQLDELDALLQRMLSLPVAPPDEEPNLPEEPVEMSLAVTEPPTPTSPPRAVRAVALPLAIVLESTPAPVVAASVDPEPPVLPQPRRRPMWPRPLVWSNRAFDRCTEPLGAPGRWLQGQRGRAFLGFLGLLCLAAAVAVVAMDWAGWIW